MNDWVWLLWMALAATGLLLLLAKKSGASVRPQVRRPARAAPAMPSEGVATQPAAPAALTRPPIVRTVNPQVEAMLQAFEPTRAADLPAADAAAIRNLLVRIPRPPNALHKLVSPAFLASANTTDLSEMVLAEPQVAAKLLAAVNSPLYALHTPLASLGQAVTFLGMNTVRAMCLQYLLDESFTSQDPEIKKSFDGLWQASALASELCFRLAQGLQLPEPGALVTQVVLSFLGPVTSHALLPKNVMLGMASKSFLERSRMEQEQLGLCASELGTLLMQQWELPPGITEPVRQMDLVLTTPCGQMPSPAQERQAFCYACARLGEKLAGGSLQDLAAYALEQDSDPDLYYLQSYLQLPALERMPEMLRKPALAGAIQAMVLAMRFGQPSP